MLTASQKLIELLNLNKGKPSFKRTFNFKLYPFLQETQKELNLIMGLLLF